MGVTVDLVKIGFTAAKQYFKSLGEFYKKGKNQAEAIKIQQLLQQNAPIKKNLGLNRLFLLWPVHFIT